MAEFINDENVILRPERQSQAQIRKGKFLAIVGAAILILMVAAIVTLLIRISSISNKVTTMQHDIKSNEAIISMVDKDMSLAKELADDANKTGRLIRFERYLENGVVTDELTVNKAAFLAEKNNVNAVIDVDTQPTTSLKYKGTGNFDMPDREVRAMVQSVIDKVKENYIAFQGNNEEFMPDWSKANVSVTIKNYEIGSYSNGTFVLKGEK